MSLDYFSIVYISIIIKVCCSPCNMSYSSDSPSKVLHFGQLNTPAVFKYLEIAGVIELVASHIPLFPLAP